MQSPSGFYQTGFNLMHCIQEQIKVTEFNKKLSKPLLISLNDSLLCVGDRKYVFESRQQRDRVYSILAYAADVYARWFNLPWEWGGVRPEPIEAEGFDPFVDNQKRYSKQPPGEATSGIPMVGGFDCSGFVRYILGEFRIGSFPVLKKKIVEYLSEAGDICTEIGKVSLDAEYDQFVWAKCLPHDVIVLKNNNGNTMYSENHMSLYIGDGYVLECNRKKKPYFDLVPNEEWKRWQRVSKGREDKPGTPLTDWDRGGIQINRLSKTCEKKRADHPEINFTLHILRYEI